MREQNQRPADLGHGAADGVERHHDAVGRGAGFLRRAVDQLQLLHEAAIGVREADDARGRAAPAEGALKALDQPRAEGIQPFKLGEVDDDVARALVASRGLVDDFFKLGRALGRPGAGRGERYAFALGRGGQRGRAQAFLLRARPDALCDP